MEKFWTNVNKAGPVIRPELGRCWLWKGVSEADGYARVSVSTYGEYLAHRAAWRIENGNPGDFKVLHKCDNRKCCRPDHLFLGTAKDNGEDMAAKGRHADVRGTKHPGTRLTELNVLSIRKRYELGESQASIAKDFDLTNQAVYLIVRRKTWKHI